jgi:3-oxoacyl-[acyl-carrier protein] reductase
LLLTGKNAVITGCLRGIGRETLRLFVEQGANVWACAQASDEEFEAFCRQLADTHGQWVKPVYFDLSDHDAIKAAMRSIQADKQPVDCLVNVAGLTRDALVHMTTMDQLRLVFDVNLFSQILVTQYLTKLMMRQKRGSVINVSSISGIDGNAGQLSYSASKAALIGVTKTLSRELGQHGIRVNAVAPGVIDTEMNAVVPRDVLANRVAQTSLSRLGTPREVAGTIAFLASDISAYMTGQIIRIDGGMN